MFFQANINMSTRIIRISTHIVYFVHSYIPYQTRGKKIQRNKFVIGVRRGHRQSVQRGGTVSVSKAPHKELACFGK